VFRIAQENLVESRQQQLRIEADHARLASRIHRPQPRTESRARSVLNLRFQFAR
jgi:hypothetical protein